MGLGNFLYSWIHRRVIQFASGNRAFDIIEVRTKELTLTYVNTETDIRIRNDFFLPITILAIETDIINSAGTRVGKMSYREPKRLKGHSAAVFTTRSKLSNITAFFHALQHLLAMPVSMRSVGTAQIKLLWWTFDIPVDDSFEIRSSQVRMTEPVSEEEKKRQAEKREQRRAERERKKQESGARSQEPGVGGQEPIVTEEETLTIEIDAQAIEKLPADATVPPADTDIRPDETSR